MQAPFLLSYLLPVMLVCAPAPGAIDQTAATAEHAIERAGHCTDAAALANTIKLLDTALAAAPDQPALLYTRGYAAYVDSELHRGPKDHAACERALREADRILERVKGAPWEAEASAMRGAVLGSLIALQEDIATAGATLGPEAGRLLAAAAAAAPNSPRVLLFRGQSLLFTPPEYGGDPAEGATLLQKAADGLAASAPPDGPRWGHAEALAWLGLAKKQAGDLAAARAAWQQALAIEPNYAWVKFALLPSLGQPPPAK